MSGNNTLKWAVRGALLASAAAAAASAYAADPEQKITEVVVTGSRIVRQDFEAASPVTTINADTFKLSGETQVETVLNSLPQLVPSITTTSNNPSNGGQANVNLRGLGSARTLVLLDGARLPPSGTDGVVDLNIIPSALIESVEILTGGASSTYGSDAIAGVVNVRTKRNFEGVQISAQSNVTEESDGRTFIAEALVGGNFAEDRGNAVLSFSYDKREEVLAGAREFGVVSRGPTLAPSGSATIPGGRIDWGAVAGQANQPSQAALNNVFGRFGAAPGAVTGAAPIGFNPNGTLFSIGVVNTPDNVVNYLGDKTDPGFNEDIYSYNFGPVNYLQLPLERRQVAAFGRYDIVPDGGAEIYARMMFTTYNSDQQLAATPVTCSGAALGCLVPVTNSTIPADLRELLQSRPNPTTALNFTTRTTDVGPRIQENGYDVLQSLLGFRGDFAVGERDFHWDVFGSWGRVEGTSLQEGNVSRQRLQAALNDPTVYASRGCAVFNPFGEGNLSGPCAQAIAIKASNILEYELTNVVASLSGPLFDLPGGSVDFAIGAEYREENASFRPDEFLASGDVVGFNAQQPVDGRITVKEPFAELVVPILSGKPFADYIGLEFGYRNSEYNLAGNADTYKAALQWSPIPALKLRGSYNRAIRAPSIQDLFLPRQENFPSYTDPCNRTSSFRYGTGGQPGGTGGAADGPNPAAVEALCVSQGIPQASIANFNQLNPQARSFVGGNLELTPEEADTYTVGIAWQSQLSSQWLDQLAISVDYFNYDITNVIQSLTVSSILGKCFNQLGTNPNYSANNASCQLFSRNPANSSVTDAVTTQLNLAARKVDGIDLNIDWGIPLTVFGASDSAGDLGFQLRMTKLMSWQQQETEVDPFVERKGTIGQTVASAYPEFKGVLSTIYSLGDLQLRYNLRYIDGMDVVNNDALLTASTAAVPSVDTYLYHDFTARYTFNKMLGLTLGVTNIENKAPPVYTTNAQAGIQSNTDPSTYDVLGRRYFLNLTATF